ncbi:MAG TPA: ribonuclease P protein component [Candidatus Saccharimonadales bacterium]|nr:ribonuclease P protein component [Candidatus Saccharimonadales bacterium]
MFGRSHRFHGHNALAPVYKRGSTVRGAQISLKFVGRGGDRPYRVAVVVSRKVNKSAVVRNRIRRRIYEAVRISGSVPAGYDLIFTVFHDQVADWPAAKLSAQISELLDKIAA